MEQQKAPKITENYASIKQYKNAYTYKYNSSRLDAGDHLNYFLAIVMCCHIIIFSKFLVKFPRGNKENKSYFDHLIVYFTPVRRVYYIYKYGSHSIKKEDYPSIFFLWKSI